MMGNSSSLPGASVGWKIQLSKERKFVAAGGDEEMRERGGEGNEIGKERVIVEKVRLFELVMR
jgi:hypothetical protein